MFKRRGRKAFGVKNRVAVINIARSASIITRRVNTNRVQRVQVVYGQNAKLSMNAMPLKTAYYRGKNRISNNYIVIVYREARIYS